MLIGLASGVKILVYLYSRLLMDSEVYQFILPQQFVASLKIVEAP